MARSFNGTSAFISAGNASILNPSAITVSAWVYWLGSYQGSGNEQWFVARDDNSLGRAYTLGLSGSSPLLSAQINGGVLTATAGNLSANSWAHIAFTGSSAAGYTAYLNGSAGTPLGSGTSMSSTTGSTTIGERTYASFNGLVSGSIADVAIWNTILTGGNITSLANGVRPINVNSANLVGWWPLDGYASPEPDLSGNGNNGTLTGTTGIIGPPQLWRLG